MTWWSPFFLRALLRGARIYCRHTWKQHCTLEIRKSMILQYTDSLLYRDIWLPTVGCSYYWVLESFAWESNIPLPLTVYCHLIFNVEVNCTLTLMSLLVTLVFVNSNQMAVLREHGRFSSLYSDDMPLAMLQDITQVFPQLKSLMAKQDKEIQPYLTNGTSKRQRMT